MATRGRGKKADPIEDFFTKGFTQLAVVLTVVAIAWALVSEFLTAIGPTGVRILGGLAASAAGAWVWSRQSRKRRIRSQSVAHAIWQAGQDRLLETADVMNGTEFEHLVKRLLIRDGFNDVRVAGGACDRGADVFARSPSGLRVVVQCKRYRQARSVKSAEMQLFVGMAWNEHNAQRPLYVTTSQYTREARAVAAKHGIYLIGRTQLGTWMSGGTAFDSALAPIPRQS